MTRQIDEIIVHSTATREGWMADQSVSRKVAEIRKWHVSDRGWRDIGYAAIIDRDGSIGWGRDLDNDGDYFDDVGAHTKGRNSRSVGVALVGGFGSAVTDSFSDNFTDAQDRALRKIIGEIEEYAGRKLIVSGHNQYANKACPGFYVPDWYKNRQHRNLAGSKTMQAAGGGAAATAVGGVTAVGNLDGTAQIIATVTMALVLLLFMFIMRERIKKWVRGIR